MSTAPGRSQASSHGSPTGEAAPASTAAAGVGGRSSAAGDAGSRNPQLSPQDYQDLTQMLATYAAVVDAADWDAWVAMFTDDCIYKLIPRENYERGLPLATMDFESRCMLMDRAYAIRETLFHDPYYQRHVLGAPRLLEASVDRIICESNYAVFRTKLSELTTVFNVGRYLDTVVRTESGWRFASKLCIYDSEMIPNSIIYPV